MYRFGSVGESYEPRKIISWSWFGLFKIVLKAKKILSVVWESTESLGAEFKTRFHTAVVHLRVWLLKQNWIDNAEYPCRTKMSLKNACSVELRGIEEFH